jgi:L-2,4-diaminobutyrate decarboxylase
VTHQWKPSIVNMSIDLANLLEEILSTLPSASQQIISSYISEHTNIESKPIIKLATKDEASSIRSLAQPKSESRPIPEVISEASKIFANRIRNEHPRFFGFIPTPVSPVALLGDILTSAVNPHGGSWLQSSGPASVEVALIRWLGTMTGLPVETSGGLFVSGGSMANLVGLMCARDQMLGDDWEARAKGVVYVSDQTHLSIAKGLRILGFNNRQIHMVESDSNFKMDLVSLRQAVAEDQERALIPFLIVASCGTTNTGSVDPLRALAKFTREQSPRMWLHVDGAYGASVSLSKNHKHMLDGLEDADSISWDAHKWLFQTYGCGMALVRDRTWLMKSFATGAEYTRDAAESGHYDSPNFWNFGPELTRPVRAMRLWFTLQVLGLDAVGAMIDHGFELAEVVEREIRKLPDWQIVSSAKMAIVSFRFEPKGRSEEELDALNAAISAKMLKDNVAGALTTKLLGKIVIRICAISPNLSEEGMCSIVRALDEAGQLLLAV